MTQLHKTHAPCYPLLSLMGVIGGLLVGLIIFPADPLPRGALVWSALALSAGLLSGPFIAVLHNPMAFFRVEHLLSLGLIYWILLDLIQASFDLYSVSAGAVEHAFLLVGIFGVGFWLPLTIIHVRPPSSLHKFADTILISNTVFAAVIFCFAMGMLEFFEACNFSVVCLIGTVNESRFAVPWARGPLGGWHSFFHHATYFGYLLGVLTVVLKYLERRFTWRVLIATSLTTLFLIFIVRDGDRRIVGMIVGSAILVWVMLQPHLTWRHYVGLSVIVGLLLLLMQLMVVYRYGGVFSILEKEQPLQLSMGHGIVRVDKNFLYLSEIVDRIPAQHPYVYEEQLVYALVRPIPRVFWPDKPVDAGFDLARELGHKYGHTKTFSIVGNWYMVWGWPAVFVGGIVLGFLASASSSFLQSGVFTPTRALMYALMAMALFVGLRAMHVLIIMSYPLLAWLGILWLRERFSTSPSKPKLEVEAHRQ